MKLIKLSDTHYIIVDDSKKVFSGIGWNNETKTINIFVSHPKYNEEFWLWIEKTVNNPNLEDK